MQFLTVYKCSSGNWTRFYRDGQKSTSGPIIQNSNTLFRRWSHKSDQGGGLSEIRPSNGILDFNPKQKNYTISLDDEVESLAITPVTTHGRRHRRYYCRNPEWRTSRRLGIRPWDVYCRRSRCRPDCHLYRRFSRKTPFTKKPIRYSLPESKEHWRHPL